MFFNDWYEYDAFTDIGLMLPATLVVNAVNSGVRVFGVDSYDGFTIGDQYRISYSVDATNSTLVRLHFKIGGRSFLVSDSKSASFKFTCTDMALEIIESDNNYGSAGAEVTINIQPV